METTLDSIRDILIVQSRRGYRFSVDALILEHFVSPKHSPQILELGAGSGIISLLLAKRINSAKIVAVEIQEKLAAYARENVRLNRLDKQVEIVRADIRELCGVFSPNSFDILVANPPFRNVRSGRMSPDQEKAVARHEVCISLGEIVKAASCLLGSLGKLYMVYHPFRMVELIRLLHRSGLEPKRLRFVHSRQNEEAKMVLVESVKGAGPWLKVDSPLCIYGDDNQYTEEMKGIYGR